MSKTLAKSSTDRKISGVCGGIAEYFNIDSTIIRLIFALSIIFWGFGLLIYIIAAIIMPMDYEADNTYNKRNAYSSQKTGEYTNEQSADNTASADNTDNSTDDTNSKKDFDSGLNNNKKSNLSGAAIFGIILVAIGIICLINIFFPAFNYGVIFAALIVALGVLIIIKGGR